MKTLDDLAVALEQRRIDQEEFQSEIFEQMLELHPDLKAYLEECHPSDPCLAQWFCAPYFDVGTKSAIELLAEEREDEAMSLFFQRFDT